MKFQTCHGPVLWARQGGKAANDHQGLCVKDQRTCWNQNSQDHGGVKAALYHLYWTDDLKTGTHVGTDEYGNKYYHNPAYFRGRDR